MRELLELLEDLGRGRGGCLVVDDAALAAIHAEGGDLQVIRYRASADEQLLAYAALSEICEPLTSLIEQLPPLQSAALCGALALGPPTGDALAVAVGFRSLLHVAAERRPVLLVVEDAHLLDRGSAAAIAFAARRIAEVAVGIVISQDPAHLGRLDVHGARRLAAPKAAAASATAQPYDDGALDRAVDRGSAPDLAAALEAHAAAEPGPHRGQTLTRAAQAWLDAGQVERALAAATEARSLAAEDVDVAAAELALGRIHALLGNGRTSAGHLRAAADSAAAGAPVIAISALLLTVPGALFSGRVDDAEAAVAEAAARLDEAGLADDDPMRAMHDAACVAVTLARGEHVDPERVTRAAARLSGPGGPAEDLALVAMTVALPLIWLERYDHAGGILRDLIGRMRRRGALGALPTPLCVLSICERRAGRPSRALTVAAEARDLAEQTGNRAAWLFAQGELANIHSLFGDVERCRSAADAILGPGGAGRGALRTSALSALATVELWAGDPKEVIALLEPLAADHEGLSQSVTLFHHTLLTAYAAIGRRDDAARLLRELEQAVPQTGGRLDATVARCAALLAPPEERDAAFERAVERAGGQPMTAGLTRLLHARRVLADGELARAAELLHELAVLDDENLLGVARAARLSLTRLGLVVSSGDPAWARLGPMELQVAIAAIEETPALTLADRLRVSPPEIERLRDEVLAVVGARSGPDVAEGMHRTPSEAGGGPPPVEVRVLGGLSVLVEGRPADVPAGAVSVALAVLALRRAVHVEELTDVLWPDASLEVARRRLRNVLSRIRQSVGPIVIRRGDRIELADGVVVDHHLLESRARRVLAEPPGPNRAARLAELLEQDRGPLLPEAVYEEWSQAARRRAEVRHEELAAALADERAGGP